jgi:hypothetical protein
MVQQLKPIACSVVVLITTAVTNVAAGPQTKCLAGKNRCVSKKVGSLLKCERRAETPGGPADPNFNGCIDKAKAKFDGGSNPAKGCFESLETTLPAGCVTSNDTASLEMLVDACVTAIVEAIDPGSIAQHRCDIGKNQCAAKKLKSILKCHQEAETPGKPNDPNFNACIDKAKAKFDGGSNPTKGCFEKLENRTPNDCLPPLDNMAAVEGIIDNSCVGAFVTALETPTTTTTSTTCPPSVPTCSPFTKIATGSIVTARATYWNGSWGDYDDDGWLDLFVGSSFASSIRNYLYHNDRDGTFTLVDDAAMPKLPSNQHGSAWGDYDNDGHLDLIVTAGNPEITHNVLYHNNGDGTFSAITTGPIYTETYVNGFHAPSWADYDNDGFIDLFIAGHDIHNRLFHNNGDGSFTRITDSVLVNDTTASEGRSWVDYDDDGDLDLFVSSNAPFKSFLYRNDGAGVFTTVVNSGLTERVENSFASCFADYDNDRFPDLFLANAPTNSLYHNNGNGTFTSLTDSVVVADVIPPNEIFSSCAWGDYDNDGFIDLFVTAGAPGGDFTSHNFLYHNDGDGTFTKVTVGAVVTDHTTSPGASWGDYDNDGFLDLFVSQGAFVPFPLTNVLYHNNGNENAWLNVKLVGTVSNRSAIGAKVRVNAFYRGESRWQLRDISGGDSESNQQSLNAEFGLADATTIDMVRIEWPSGIVQELRDVAPRQFLTVTEP